MRKIFILISLVLLFVSCKKKEQKGEEILSNPGKYYPHIEKLKWLIGNWTNLTPEQQSYESWIQKNDSTLSAYSYTMVLGDTVFEERMDIQENADSVVLVVSVPSQNDEKPVTFGFHSDKNNVYTFVNDRHDFPNKISYTNPVKDSIHAWVEGKIDSTYRKIDFYFKRSN